VYPLFDYSVVSEEISELILLLAAPELDDIDTG
jgi:hypothetical protein